MSPEPASLPIAFRRDRDLGELRDALTEWMRSRTELGPEVRVTRLEYPSGAGLSNETILFEVGAPTDAPPSQRFVLRVEPGDDRLFLEPRFRQQYELLMSLVGERDVPVPTPCWYEPDPEFLGRPFFVMERIEGRVPVSAPPYNAAGWLAEAVPAQRRTAWVSAIRTLAAIHRVPVDRVAVLDRGCSAAPGPSQELAYWEGAARWCTEGTPPPPVRELFGHLEAHAPRDAPLGLAWGDARMGNLMFADDFTVVGVLDWEQASLGGGLQDLAWWLLFDDFHSVEMGLARLDGLGTRDETLALWSESTGESVEGIEWYEIFVALQMAIVALRSRQLYGPRHGDLYFLERACRLAGIDPSAVM